VTVWKAVDRDTEKDTEKDTENQRKILSAIEQNPSASQEGIAQVVGINRANVAKNLKKQQLPFLRLSWASSHLRLCRESPTPRSGGTPVRHFCQQ
jgi:hypothetical protein